MTLDKKKASLHAQNNCDEAILYTYVCLFNIMENIFYYLMITKKIFIILCNRVIKLILYKLHFFYPFKIQVEKPTKKPSKL